MASDLTKEQVEAAEEEFVLSLFLPENSVNVTSRNVVDSTLRNAESDFLSNSSGVRTANVSLEELNDRFLTSNVPSESTLPKTYYDSLLGGTKRTANDSVRTASPAMVGHMTSSLPYYLRPLSRLVTAMNQNAVKTETANVITFLEKETLAQLHRAVYKRNDEFYEVELKKKDSVLGVFTSGGTLANLTALWVARNSAFEDVEKRGVRESAVVIGSELLHYSLAKNLDVLGLGTDSLKTVPYDDDFRIKISKLREEMVLHNSKGVKIMCVVGIAGTTETGSVDDLSAIADLCDEFKCHFHVDAAWGGPGVFSAKQNALLLGIERADTVTVDGHKQLYIPLGCGMLLFRRPSLSGVVKKTARYIIRSDSYDLGRFTIEGSRPANSVYLHSNLNILGRRGYEILVNRSLRLTKFFAGLIEDDSDFELLLKPQTNILLYRAVAKPNKDVDALNVKLQAAQTARGKTFVSRTTVFHPKHERHLVALRVVIANPLTYEADLRRVLEDQKQILASFDEDASSVAIEKQPNNRAYWLEYWNSKMTVEGRSMFRDDFDFFLNTLVAPDLKVEDGIFPSVMSKRRKTS